MRLAPFASVMIILAGLSMPASAPAQSNAQQGKIWMSAGAGGGWARVSCSICNLERNLGPTGYVRVGTNLRPGLLLSTEGNVWTHVPEEDTRSWVGAIGAAAYMYPRANGALYVKGGLGYMMYRSRDDEDNEISTSSLGVQLGAGYEFRVGSTLLITNFANLLASSFGTLRADEAVVDDVNVTLLQIGVGVTRR